ncbi:MAG: IS1380 family transposase, partial [Acidimicrobiales bacterium]
MDSRTARVNHHRGAKDQLCVSQMFTWGHVAQLDRVFDESIRRSWAAGAEPGQGPVTLDVDSTICETYGLKKQGARFGYTSRRGYHPLLATVAGTEEVV